jgi:hypothetical protein
MMYWEHVIVSTAIASKFRSVVGAMQRNHVQKSTSGERIVTAA